MICAKDVRANYECDLLKYKKTMREYYFFASKLSRQIMIKSLIFN
jgi:hypothetical protein